MLFSKLVCFLAWYVVLCTKDSHSHHPPVPDCYLHPIDPHGSLHQILAKLYEDCERSKTMDESVEGYHCNFENDFVYDYPSRIVIGSEFCYDVNSICGGIADGCANDC